MKRHIILLLAALVLCCGFGTCRDDEPKLPIIGGNPAALVGPSPTIGKIATTAPPSEDIKQNEKDQEEARTQAQFWNCRLSVEEDKGKRLVAAERQHWLEAICRALMGMCLFGMLASGFAFAASFIWPWFERLRYAAIAGVGAATVIFCIAWYLPTQIFYIGIAIAICTVVGVIMLFQHSHVVGRAEKLAKRDLNGDGKIG